MLGTAGSTRPPWGRRSLHPVSWSTGGNLLLAHRALRWAVPPAPTALPSCQEDLGHSNRVSGPQWSLHAPIQSLLWKQQLSLPSGPSSHSTPSHPAPVPWNPG